MKAEIHPEYHDVTAVCSCGNTFRTRSTEQELRVELCNVCHPFFTGKQRLVDSGGRVERFQRRYGQRNKAKTTEGKATEAKTSEAEATEAETTES